MQCDAKRVFRELGHPKGKVRQRAVGTTSFGLSGGEVQEDVDMDVDEEMD